MAKSVTNLTVQSEILFCKSDCLDRTLFSFVVFLLRTEQLWAPLSPLVTYINPLWAAQRGNIANGIIWFDFLPQYEKHISSTVDIKQHN